MTPFMVVYALIYWDIFLLQRFLVCVSIVDFWFAVILKFWCKSLYVYEIVLSCCSLNCKFISSVLHLYPPLLMISDFGGIIVHGWALSFVAFLFPVAAFSFLPREVPLVFVVRLVSCCWILLAFAYLWRFWFLLQIWMRALLGQVILVGGFFLSSR